MESVNLTALELVVDRGDCSPLQARILKRKLRKMARRGQLSFESLDPEMRYKLFNARAMNGDFSNWDGWEFRSEWSKSLMALDLPRWCGEHDKVYILGEQGLGDEIAYASCIPEMIVRLGHDNVVLECQDRLISVFERSFRIQCTPRRDLDVDRDGYIAALGDVPRFFRRDLSHFPGLPYLKPDPDRFRYWQSWLNGQGSGPFIGVAWEARQGRLALDSLTQTLTGCLISLQYGDFDPSEGVIIPPLDPIKDFADQINLIAALDRVVSLPMTVVHVAGALGVPCDVILLPWLEGFEDTQDRLDWSFGRVCPWYKSVNIHRSLDGWKTAQPRKQGVSRRKTG